jgi:endonuclease YncB( thermonuclease family)
VEVGALILLATIVVAAIIAMLLSSRKSASTACAPAGAASELQRVKVQHVIDGDTVIVSKSWSDIRVRLDAIDCPEDGQHWGNIAKAGLIKLIGGRHVHLETHGVDGHGRTLGTIYVQLDHGQEWINVNERMVMRGHAWVTRKYFDHLPQSRKDQLNRLERWARSKRVGLWKTNNPIPPWQWRSHDR